jgi:hypothetical protein
MIPNSNSNPKKKEQKTKDNGDHDDNIDNDDHDDEDDDGRRRLARTPKVPQPAISFGPISLVQKPDIPEMQYICILLY